MKRFFSFIGVIVLMVFSFIYTEKTVLVVKQFDDIMIEINNIKDQYKINSKDATIDGNSIIPGKSGREIDVNKSYYEMKKINKFNTNLLMYKKVKPTISVEDNKDKYIIRGNKENKVVSLIFVIDNLEQLEKIEQIKNNNKVDFNYYINNINKLDIKDTILLNKRNKELNKIIKKTEEITFCYYENINYLKECSKDSYTVKPKEISKYPLKSTKEILESGSIISYKVDNTLLKELDIIIKYINSKGLEIVSLEELIIE